MLAIVAAVAATALVFSVAAQANPPDPATVGWATLSGIELNGTPGTVLTVAPGADVQMTANWTDSDSGCPSCIDQVEVAFAGQGTPTPTDPSDPNAGGTFAGGGCIEQNGFDGESGIATADLGDAPTTPGTYDVYANDDEGYWCGQDFNSNDVGYVVVAQITIAEAAPTGGSASISGTAQAGQTLIADTSGWSPTPTSYTYDWQDCDPSCSDNGGTGSSYLVGSGDVGSTIQVIVTAHDSGGTGSATSAQTSTVLEAAPTGGSASISGTAQQGQTLIADTSGWSPTPTSYTYDWQDCDPSCSDNGGTGSSYLVGSGDVGSTIQVIVTAHDSGGTGSATSAQTSTVLAPPPPTVAISTPSSGAYYSVGQVVHASYTCTEGAGGPGLLGGSSGCSGTVASGAAITTGSPGGYSFTVTANSLDGESATTTYDYTVAAAPTVTITTPVSGAIYAEGQVVPASYTCADGVDGPGLAPGGCVATWLDGAPINTALSGGHSLTVIATSLDGQSTTTTYNYTIGSPPTASITTPANGAFYATGQSVTANYSCAEGAGGPGLLGGNAGCSGPVANGTAINTSSPGSHTFAVTATSQDTASTTTTYSYTVANAPTASITTPGGGVYAQGQVVATSFSCSEGTDGPGLLASGGCVDNNGGTGSGGHLNTSALGANQSYTVTATSQDGQTAMTTILYTVAAPPTASISAPTNNQTYPLNQSVPTTFSCTEGANGPGIASCTDSNGSTSPGALVTSAVGSSFSYTVTATSHDGQTATSTINYSVVYVKPANTALPAVSGTAMQGQTLSASTGTWTGDPTPTFTYQWERCDNTGANCANITGAAASSYVASAADVGDTLLVAVTGTNAGGQATALSATTSVVLTSAPSNTVLPSISGTAQVGATLSVSNGTWLNSPFAYTYQWQQCDTIGDGCVQIPGAQSNTYTAGSGDIGDTLSVIVTATNANGSNWVTSTPSQVVSVAPPANNGAPSISGTVQQGQTLSADVGSWTNSPTGFTYQWLRCDASGAGCGAISGAAASSYVPSSDDVGNTLEVTVTASNSSGGSSASSGPTAVVLIAPPVAVSAPSLSGSTQLSASTGSWNNSPTTFTYQWLQCDATGANCQPIPGAMSSSYVPSASDAGHALRVTVTATNSSGSTSSTSFPTEAVNEQASLTPPPPPVLDSSTNLNPVSGTILIKIPGSTTFKSVPVGANVPIGSTINAINGTVSITVALPNGKTQTGEFYDGEFVLTQAPSGTTIPVLTGGSFNGCPTSGQATAGKNTARAAKSKKKPGTVVRQLWGNAHGNYTTKGRYGSASVSGTIWLVQDRCDGTYIEATKDNVIVVAYANPNKKINIQQGQHILLPAPGF